MWWYRQWWWRPYCRPDLVGHTLVTRVACCIYCVLGLFALLLATYPLIYHHSVYVRARPRCRTRSVPGAGPKPKDPSEAAHSR